MKTEIVKVFYFGPNETKKAILKAIVSNFEDS